MAKSLSELKKNRKASFENLQKEVEKQSKSDGGGPKEGYWRPSRKENGEIMVVLRFLPADYFEGKSPDFVRIVTNNFKGPKGHYNETSLKTLGKSVEDPVAKFNNHLWNGIGGDAGEKQASNQKQNVKFVSNVLIVNDTANTDNNGKVFKYEFPTTIFKKMEVKVTPDAATGEKPCDIFDPLDGCNFTLKAEMKKDPKTKKEFPDYSMSGFQNPSPLCDGDEDGIKAILAQCQPLNDLIDPAKMKTYDELEKLLVAAMGMPIEDLMSNDYVPYTVGRLEKKAKTDTLAKLEKETNDLSSMLDDEAAEGAEDDIPKEWPVKEVAKAKAPAKKAVAKKAPVVEADEDLQDLADLDDLADI